MASVAAAFAARSGQQEDVNAIGRVFGEGASHAQGFVVRVREHGHQPRCHSHSASKSENGVANRLLRCPEEILGYMRGNAVSDLGAVSH